MLADLHRNFPDAVIRLLQLGIDADAVADPVAVAAVDILELAMAVGEAVDGILLAAEILTQHEGLVHFRHRMVQSIPIPPPSSPPPKPSSPPPSPVICGGIWTRD